MSGGNQQTCGVKTSLTGQKSALEENNKLVSKNTSLQPKFPDYGRNGQKTFKLLPILWQCGSERDHSSTTNQYCLHETNSN